MAVHEHNYFEIIYTFGNQWQCECGYQPDEHEWTRWADKQNA